MTLQFLKTNQQLKSVEDLFSKESLNKEPKNQIEKIKMIEQKIIRDGLIYKIGIKKG